jgi:hypothetical protein
MAGNEVIQEGGAFFPVHTHTVHFLPEVHFELFGHGLAVDDESRKVLYHLS